MVAMLEVFRIGYVLLLEFLLLSLKAKRLFLEPRHVVGSVAGNILAATIDFSSLDRFRKLGGGRLAESALSSGAQLFYYCEQL